MNRKFFIHIAGVFLLGFTFIFVCYVGLPADFNVDHISTNVRGAKASSYLELIKFTVNPLTPAWFYPAKAILYTALLPGLLHILGVKP